MSEVTLARVCTVVVTYNGVPWAESCLQSLMDSLYPVRVIVVDNASSDSTLSVVNQFADVICVALNENVGFGAANNVGIHRALEECADFVFLLNQDARVHPETIGKLVSWAQENDGFGIVSPIHLNSDGTEIDYLFARHIARAANPSLARLLSDFYFGHLDAVYSVSFVNAAAWLISRACLEMVGGFDPLLFMYGEDDDFCHRVIYHGFSIGLVPSAVIFHSRNRNDNMETTLSARLNREPHRRATEMMVSLKQPSRRFVSNTVHWFNDTLHQGLRCILKRDLKNFSSLSLAVVETVVHLLQIWKHHKICRSPGPHWI